MVRCDLIEGHIGCHAHIFHEQEATHIFADNSASCRIIEQSLDGESRVEAGGARCCEQGFTAKSSNASRRGTAYFAAGSGGPAEQAETAVELQAERDGKDSEAALSGFCHDAPVGSQNRIWLLRIRPANASFAD